MPFDWSGVFDIDDWDQVVSVLTDDEKIPSTSTFEAIDTGALSGTYPKMIRAIAGSGVVTNIDPVATATPVQDAIDTIHAETADGGGTIILPPKRVIDESTALTGAEQIDIRGYGPTVSEIKFTSDGSTTDDNGFEYGTTGFHSDSGGLFNLSLQGPGVQTTSGSAIKFTGNHRGLTLDRVRIAGWGTSWIDTNGNKPYEITSTYLKLLNAGSTGINLDTCGPGVTFGVVEMTGSQYMSGPAITGGQGNTDFQFLNMGGEYGTSSNSAIIDLKNGVWNTVRIGGINYEPNAGTNASSLVRVGPNAGEIGPITLRANASVDHIIGIDGDSAVIKGRPIPAGGTVNVSPVGVLSDLTQGRGARFEGPSSEVTNQTGSSLSNPVYCWDSNVT